MCFEMTTNRRILSINGSRPVRRNLFGPVDREQLRVEYQTALRKDVEEASRRWGFDFMADEPLEGGDFQWESVPGARVPFLYRSCVLGQGQIEDQRAAAVVPAPSVSDTPKRRKAESARSQKENIPVSPEKGTINLEKVEKTWRRGESFGLKRKQANITDFYQAKRRVVGMTCKSGD